MSYQLDHLVVLVEDLAAASDDYTERGFTVTPGGEHTDGATHNALIAFADGSYIELITFKREAPEHRWWRFAAFGEGLIDWALLPNAIGQDIAAANAAGVTYTGPFDGGRMRPDGTVLRWQTGLPPTPDLPFLCADVTPRTLRVPQGAAQQHANGYTGIRELRVAVSDLAASMARYTALFGVEPAGTSFALGSTTITLVDAEDATARARLGTAGEGPNEVSFGKEE